MFPRLNALSIGAQVGGATRALALLAMLIFLAPIMTVAAQNKLKLIDRMVTYPSNPVPSMDPAACKPKKTSRLLSVAG